MNGEITLSLQNPAQNLFQEALWDSSSQGTPYPSFFDLRGPHRLSSLCTHVCGSFLGVPQ